jgi:hypothetical protein
MSEPCVGNSLIHSGADVRYLCFYRDNSLDCENLIQWTDFPSLPVPYDEPCLCRPVNRPVNRLRQGIASWGSRLLPWKTGCTRSLLPTERLRGASSRNTSPTEISRVPQGHPPASISH